MKTRHVWVVEIKFEGRREYWPTVGCGLTQDEAAREMAKWRTRNPDDQFRITKYEAQP